MLDADADIPEIDKLHRMVNEILAQPNASGEQRDETLALFQLEVGYSIYETLLKVINPHRIFSEIFTKCFEILRTIYVSFAPR